MRRTRPERGDSKEESNMENKRFITRALTGLALLTAIVVVLQLLGSFIRFGTFSISLVLVPIVVGAALYGSAAGAWLGFVFGVVVILQPDTAFFMNYNPAATVIVCLLKGAAAGLCAGLIYRLLEKGSRFAAVLAAAVVCPVVNSGIFFLGSLLFFIPLIEEAFEAPGDGVKIVLLTMIGGSFLFEVLFNLVLSPVILRLIDLGKRGRH